MLSNHLTMEAIIHLQQALWCTSVEVNLFAKLYVVQGTFCTCNHRKWYLTLFCWQNSSTQNLLYMQQQCMIFIVSRLLPHSTCVYVTITKMIQDQKTYYTMADTRMTRYFSSSLVLQQFSSTPLLHRMKIRILLYDNQKQQKQSAQWLSQLQVPHTTCSNLLVS